MRHIHCLWLRGSRTPLSWLKVALIVVKQVAFSQLSMLLPAAGICRSRNWLDSQSAICGIWCLARIVGVVDPPRCSVHRPALLVDLIVLFAFVIHSREALPSLHYPSSAVLTNSLEDCRFVVEIVDRCLLQRSQVHESVLGAEILLEPMLDIQKIPIHLNCKHPSIELTQDQVNHALYHCISQSGRCEGGEHYLPLV